MADVGLRVKLEGAEEARQGLEKITNAANQAAFQDSQWAQVQARLKRAGEELRAEHDRRSRSLEELKKHTQGIVERVQAQMRQEEEAASIFGRVTDALKMKALQYVSVAAAIAGFVSVLKGALHASHEAAEATLRLEAVVAATGGSVGVTTQRLKELAEEWQRSTRFDSEGIKSAMAVMLTFKNVQSETFERGMKLAMDYAELYKTDLQGAVRIVGRALEDPVRGLTNLQRVIGTVSPATKDYIEELMRAGRMMEAQAVIIDLLTSKFGGFAEKMKVGVVGALAEVSQNWNELMKSIGQSGPIATAEAAVLSLTNKWLRGMKNIVDAFSDIEAARLKIARETLASELAFEFEKASARRTIQEIEARREKGRAKDELEGVKAKAAAEAAAQDALLARLQERAGLEKNRIAEITKEIKGLEEIIRDPAKRADVQAAAIERAKVLKKEQDRLLDEQAKKAQAAAEQERRLALDTLDYKVRIGELEVEDKFTLIDTQLAAVRKGSKEELALLNERQAMFEKIAKEGKKELEDRAKHETDLANKKDRDLAKIEEDATREAIRIKREEFNERAALIEKDVWLSDQAKAEKLKQLAEELEVWKSIQTEKREIEAEQRKLERKAREVAQSDQERDAKRISQAFGRANIDMTDAVVGAHKAMSGAIADVLRGARGLGSGITAFFKGVVDEVINQLARLLANDVFKLLFNIGPGGVFTGGGGGGGFFSGAVGSAAGSAGGSFAGSLLGNVASSAFGGVGGLFQSAGSFFGSQGIADIGNILGNIGQLTEAGEIFGIADAFSAAGTSFLPGPFPGFWTIVSSVLGGSGGIGEIISDIPIIGDIFDFFQHGTDSVYTQPTLIGVGEVGAERVTVSPLAGAAHRRGADGVVLNFNAPVMMDIYSMKRFVRELERWR